MWEKTISICCSMAILLLTISFWGTGTAWSAAGKDKQIRLDSSDKGILKREDTKTGKKGEKSVKKKLVKKAGATAAVGVAGKKVTSGLKGKVKDSAA